MRAHTTSLLLVTRGNTLAKTLSSLVRLHLRMLCTASESAETYVRSFFLFDSDFTGGH